MKILSLAMVASTLAAAPALAGPCSRGPPWCRGKWDTVSNTCAEPIVDLGPGYRVGDRDGAPAYPIKVPRA